MAARRRKYLTDEECMALLFNSDSDDSDIDMEDNFSDNDVSIVCPPTNADLSSSDSEDSDIEDQDSQNNDISLTWLSKENMVNIKRKEFDGCPGPQHSLIPGSLEIEYFKLLFTDAMVEDIRQNTNKYAEFVA